MHGKIYPLLIQTQKHSELSRHPHVRASLNNIEHKRKRCSDERMEKYIDRVKCRSDTLDRPLSFLCVDNCLTRRRETLIRRIFQHWLYRTYNPLHGYGYKKCLKRSMNPNAIRLDYINRIDVDNSLCTCVQSSMIEK